MRLFGHDENFVSIPLVSPRPLMGGGAVVLAKSDTGRNHHFRRSWICESLGTSSSNLRILHVGGDSMEPTLLDGDTVLVDMARRTPNPPGIFVLHDGMGAQERINRHTIERRRLLHRSAAPKT